MYAVEPTPLPVRCPSCDKLYPGYYDVFHGERVVRVRCLQHNDPVIRRAYTGTAKSNWGTVGHGPNVNEAEAGETEPQVPNVAEIERAVKEALEEMKAQDETET